MSFMRLQTKPGFPRRITAIVLAVLLVLPCAYGGDRMESTLLFLAPFRAVLLPMALLLMLPGVLKNRKSMREKGETAR